MTERIVTAADEAATVRLGMAVAMRAMARDVILLEGPLGAGKSVFARAFIRALMGDPALEVPSPTFTLVQAYERPGGAGVWHFDLWRLTGPGALEELGWDDALSKIVLVEWPDRLGALLPDDTLRVTISHAAAGREIRLQGNARWFDAP